jgi:hypothetical protein
MTPQQTKETMEERFDKISYRLNHKETKEFIRKEKDESFEEGRRQREEEIGEVINKYIPKLYNLPINQRKIVSETTSKIKQDLLDLLNKK